jgi:tetratricopeptide (TPR) repeat protein
MTTTGRNIFYLIFLIIFLPVSITSHAQRKLGLEADNWAAELSKPGLSEVNSLGSLGRLLMETDSIRALRFLDSVESSPNARGYYFKTFFSMVKADFLYSKFAGYDRFKDRRSTELQPIKVQIMKLYADALEAAYHTGKDLTIGWVSFYSARRMRSFGETSLAVMYSKNGVDLFEKENYPVEPPVYTELAELLYQVREYDECMKYARKSIAAWQKNNFEKEYKDAYKFKIQALNTIGLTCHKNNQFDSGLANFRSALQLAKQNGDTLWTARVLGNIARVLYQQQKFDSAWALLQTDYGVSKQRGIYDNAASASGWKARASLALGNKTAAITEAREAISLLALWPNGPYLRDTYYALTQIFRAMGQYDSAFYYSERYSALNDSLEKEVATSSLAISRARLNNEVSRFNIQKLNREKETVLLWRNIMIASIIIVSLIALLIINRQRLKEKIKTEKAEQEHLKMVQEKQLMETEIASAKEQLQMFTANIVEKTNLIEKLESQVKGREANHEQQAIISELARLTILTEDDWNKFRNLFEKIYPGFFMKLKDSFPDITSAEQRMAALTRLRLTTRQIASMLGISVDSVHKSRQRLRQRLNLAADASLEEVLSF